MFVSTISEEPTEKLEAEVANLYSKISAETCRWLTLVAELDRREAHLAWGCRSMAEWLSWQCGFAIRAGQEHVRVARRLEELPRIRECFTRGELSYSKVRALSRVATPETEEGLLEIARDATGAQLERVCRAYRRALPDTDPDELSERCHATLRWDDDGSLVVSARLSPEQGAILMQAFTRSRDDLCRERESLPEATGERRVSNAEALARVGERAQLAPDRSVSGGDAHQVVVHVDVATLVADGAADSPRLGEHRSEIEGGPGIAAETARRLACDAAIVTLGERDGEPLSIGRKTRSIPPALRRALRSRDGGCRFPGCTADRFIDAHHIRHWAHGGETAIDNLVSLCRHHHRLLHEGGFSVEARSGGVLIFRRPNGAELPASFPLPGVGRAPARRVDPEPPSRRDWLMRRLGPVAPRDGYQRLDLDLTLLSLMQRVHDPPKQAAA